MQVACVVLDACYESVKAPPTIKIHQNPRTKKSKQAREIKPKNK